MCCSNGCFESRTLKLGHEEVQMAVICNMDTSINYNVMLML